MEIRTIDPRTDRRWELESHDYRVVFWRQPSAPAGVPQNRVGWHAYGPDVLGALDVREVIAWADEEARKREAMYTLFAKVDYSDRPGLLWIAGVDPTVWSRPNFEVQRPTDTKPAAGGTLAYHSIDWPSA